MIGSLFGESNDPGSHRHSSLLKSKPKLDGLRLLVIDDSFLIRQALAFLLKSWGCELTLASNARIACDQFQRDKAPHIIISNFRLNDDCDGINAIRLVRKLAGRKIPAFLMGKIEDDSVSKRAQSEDLFFLRPPLPLAKLHLMLWHMLQLEASRGLDV